MNTTGDYALVLGGSKGLGLATIQKLCTHNLPVIGLHRDPRKDLPEIEAAFKDIRQRGGKLQTYQLDVLKKERRTAFIGKLPEILGDQKIGLLVYSIAKGNLKSIRPADQGRTLSGEDFRLTADAMAFALYDWASELLQAGLFASDTRIIAYTSEGSSRVLPGYGAVGAAKAALEALVRQMAVEWAPLGITANCLQAGVTDTESLRRIPGAETLLAHSRKRNPHGRLTQPEDVANAAYLLSRPEAKWINGNVIRVDGGEALN